MNPCCATNVLILFIDDDSSTAFARFTHGSNTRPRLSGCTTNIIDGFHAGDALLDRVYRASERGSTNLVARRLHLAMTFRTNHRHSRETLTAFKVTADQDMEKIRNLLHAKIESNVTIFKPNSVAHEIMQKRQYIAFGSEQLVQPL